MSLEQEPFTRYHEEKKADTFTIRLNPEERELFNKCKRLIEQPKDGTAIKTLAWIGAKVLHSSEIEYIISSVFKNKRKNRRMGIDVIE